MTVLTGKEIPVPSNVSLSKLPGNCHCHLLFVLNQDRKSVSRDKSQLEEGLAAREETGDSGECQV